MNKETLHCPICESTGVIHISFKDKEELEIHFHKLHVKADIIIWFCEMIAEKQEPSKAYCEVCGTPIDLAVNVVPVSKIEEKIAELLNEPDHWVRRTLIACLQSLLPPTKKVEPPTAKPELPE